MATCKKCGAYIKRQKDIGCFYYFCPCGARAKEIELTPEEKWQDEKDMADIAYHAMTGD